jgi:hypothetical protein
MAGDDTLMGLIGAADNFGEPMPAINRRETILGLCITFLVCVSGGRSEQMLTRSRYYLGSSCPSG